MQLKIMEPNEDFYKNHITFNSVGDIKELVKSILSPIGFNYFTFDRSYHDGSHIKLTSAGEWIEHYYRQKLYDESIWESSPEVFTDSYVFWSWLKRDPIYSAASLYDINHGLTFIKPHKNYCDFYNFGTSNENIISMQETTSNLNHLYRFIAIFCDRAHKLIKKAESARFILPLNTNRDLQLVQLSNLDQYNLGDIKHLYLGDEFDNCYLTEKEIQILYNLMLGNKVIDVAKLLFISEKTIETHISNIKNKLKCKTMFELGVIAQQLGINKIILPINSR